MNFVEETTCFILIVVSFRLHHIIVYIFYNWNLAHDAGYRWNDQNRQYPVISMKFEKWTLLKTSNT